MAPRPIGFQCQEVGLFGHLRKTARPFQWSQGLEGWEKLNPIILLFAIRLVLFGLGSCRLLWLGKNLERKHPTTTIWGYQTLCDETNIRKFTSVGQRRTFHQQTKTDGNLQICTSNIRISVFSPPLSFDKVPAFHPTRPPGKPLATSKLRTARAHWKPGEIIWPWDMYMTYEILQFFGVSPVIPGVNDHSNTSMWEAWQCLAFVQAAREACDACSTWWNWPWFHLGDSHIQVHGGQKR